MGKSFKLSIYIHTVMYVVIKLYAYIIHTYTHAIYVAAIHSGIAKGRPGRAQS